MKAAPPSVGSVVGQGGATASLTTADLAGIVGDALRDVPRGARVLAVIPDRTRDDNTATLFPLVSQQLARLGAARFDALVAQGTHPPMGDGDKRAKIGWGEAEIPLLGEVFDHHWDRPETLATIGTLASSDVRRLTSELIDQAVPVRLNARVADGSYDVVLVIGATVPHEVAGFAGGAKYFFPGIAGTELTHMTHWLGALATIERVIGRVETPTRHMIEAAADLVPVPVIALTSVMTRDAGGATTRALFGGDIRGTFRKAAQISQQVHVKYAGRRYRRVVALLDAHYDELWVGGKASYKLGAIIEPGGELIIYAPHLTQISVTHGRLIERYGYAPLEEVREMVEGSDELRANLAVAAHLAHVAYASRQTPDGRVAP
ncbi:MAG TPA: lactate racemase domain-containing protein, partial [Vicinamibacterales bacterium]